MKLFENKRIIESKQEKPYIAGGLKYATAIWFDTDKEANDFMRKNNEYGALAEYGGKVIVAKVSDLGKKTSEKMKESEGGATPSNTAGLGAFSLGNDPSNPQDVTRGSGEMFGTLKDEKLTEASMSHAEMVEFFNPKNKEFFKLWDNAWNATSGQEGACEFLASISGEDVFDLEDDPSYAKSVLTDCLSGGIFLDLKDEVKNALVDFLTSKGRLRAPKFGRRLFESKPYSDSIPQTIHRMKTEFPQFEFMLNQPTIVSVRIASSLHRHLYTDVNVATVMPAMDAKEIKKLFYPESLDVIGYMNISPHAKNSSDKMMSQKYQGSVAYMEWRGFEDGMSRNMYAPDVKEVVLKNGLVLDNRNLQFRFRDKQALMYVKEFPNIEKAYQFLVKLLKDLSKVKEGNPPGSTRVFD